MLDEWKQPVDPACRHDWVPAVGVDVDEALEGDAGVVVCRLCGLYAVGVTPGQSGAMGTAGDI